MDEWKLTSLDTFCLGMNQKTAWLFKSLPDKALLKSTLKTLLGNYPQLLGHYCEQSKSVIYDEGPVSDAVIEEVFFETVHPEVSVKSLIDTDAIGLCNVAPVWKLPPLYDVKGFKKGLVRPFSATLVTLADGVMLVVSVAHACMDAHSFYALVRQWAALCKGKEITPMTVCQDLVPKSDAFSKEETLHQVIDAGWLTIGGKQLFKMLWNLMKTNSIHYSFCMEVSQNRLRREREASGTGANATLCAIAAKTLLPYVSKKDRFKLIMTADLRGRVSGIDDSFFGNFSQAVPMKAEFETVSEPDCMARAIEADARAILDSDIPEKNLKLSVCASEYGLPYFYFDASDMNCKNPGTLYINNQLKFRPGEIEFGTGLPLYAFPNELSDMIKFWQPVAGGPVRIIFGGLAAKALRKARKQ